MQRGHTGHSVSPITHDIRAAVSTKTTAAAAATTTTTLTTTTKDIEECQSLAG